MQTLLGQGPTFADPTGRLGYVHSFSFGIQRLLPGQVTVDVSYVGSRTNRGRHYQGVQRALRPESRSGRCDPGRQSELPQRRGAESVRRPAARHLIERRHDYAAAIPAAVPPVHRFNMQDYNVGKVWYNALQITLQKRYQHGLTVTASYAFSKNLQALNYLNPQDALPSRSLTPWDRPNRLDPGAHLRIALRAGQTSARQEPRRLWAKRWAAGRRS